VFQMNIRASRLHVTMRAILARSLARLACSLACARALPRFVSAHVSAHKGHVTLKRDADLADLALSPRAAGTVDGTGMDRTNTQKRRPQQGRKKRGPEDGERMTRRMRLAVQPAAAAVFSTRSRWFRGRRCGDRERLQGRDKWLWTLCCARWCTMVG
jgi:hypothetical protein